MTRHRFGVLSASAVEGSPGLYEFTVPDGWELVSLHPVMYGLPAAKAGAEVVLKEKPSGGLVLAAGEAEDRT